MDNSLIYAMGLIQEAELHAVTDVFSAKYDISRKNELLQEAGVTLDESSELYQEGFISTFGGVYNILTNSLPNLCEFFAEKFKKISIRYKLSELKKENEKLRYQLDSQGARIESLERALGGKEAVVSGGEVTFAYDYATVTKMLEAARQTLDKANIDISDEGLDKLSRVIESAAQSADSAIRTIRENKKVKLVMSQASEAIEKGLDAVSNIPTMITELRDKAKKRQKAIEAGKAKAPSQQTASKLNGIVTGLTNLLGKVTTTGAEQMKETERVQKGRQRSVVAGNHQAAVTRKAERAREEGDFAKEQRILSDDAKKREQVLAAERRRKQQQQQSQKPPQKQAAPKPGTQTKKPATKPPVKK